MKFDFREIWYNSDRIVICAVSSKYLQCVCRNTKSYPASDGFLYHTTWYTKVNMVIIELYKPRATHMKYIGGKMRSFLSRKRLSYFILQEIPDLFSNLKCSNMQLYIRRLYIICTCKFLVKNDIIKDILKRKNDVHWISDGTVVYTLLYVFNWLSVIRFVQGTRREHYKNKILRMLKSYPITAFTKTYANFKKKLIWVFLG